MQELLQLQLREDCLNMKVNETSLSNQYRQLKIYLQKLQAKNSGETGIVFPLFRICINIILDRKNFDGEDN